MSALTNHEGTVRPSPDERSSAAPARADRASLLPALSAFVAGLIFAVGLVLGGMTQPSKVIGFLDFFGAWDPSLAFVMGGAVVTHFILFRLILRRPSPLLAERFQLPSRRDLTGSLIGGSALFGIGWGLGGYCPGPGIVGVPSGASEAAVFVLGLVGGFVVYRLFERARSSG